MLLLLAFWSIGFVAQALRWLHYKYCRERNIKLHKNQLHLVDGWVAISLVAMVWDLVCAVEFLVYVIQGGTEHKMPLQLTGIGAGCGFGVGWGFGGTLHGKHTHCVL